MILAVTNFSGFYIRNCINCVHNCEDYSLFNNNNNDNNKNNNNNKNENNKKKANKLINLKWEFRRTWSFSEVIVIAIVIA